MLVDLAKPAIRVLIYTDDDTKINETSHFGIREFRRHLEAHQPAFAVIDLQPLVSRNSGPQLSQHADRKLNYELNRDPKEPYHEVWFFGLHQKNKPTYKLKFPGGGGPRSELELDEVTALEEWMSVDSKNGSKGIGVLMSGDHANPPPDKQVTSGSTKFCPPDLDHREFLGLGRALGVNVPRAGFLRQWQGPPTHCEEDSSNTLFPPPSEIDRLAQQLTLLRFDQNGQPSSTGKPHQVFHGKNGEWIQVLPDHEHEGAVILPANFPEKIWPRKQIQPMPRYIALGTDHRTGRSLNILAAYDGDAVGVGRIISDSSWHHYFNANLNGLSVDDQDVPAADQIGQLYSNLVVWLAPVEVRRAMARTMFRWLGDHTRMIEEIGAGPLNIGNAALQLLRKVASDCEIHELLLAACPEQLRQQSETFNFPHEPEMSHLPTVEVLIGSIISKYFEQVAEEDDSSDVSEEQLTEIIRKGFIDAFVINAYSAATSFYHGLSLWSSFAENCITSEVILTFLGSLQSRSEKEKMEMITTTPYFFTITEDRDGSSELFDMELIEECLSAPLCRLSGTLKPRETPGSFDLSGFRVGAFVHFEIPFRKAKLVMNGVRDDNDDLYMRYVGAALDHPLSKSEATFAVNPDVGDTGTGTGNQTLVDERGARARASWIKKKDVEE